MPTNRQTLVRLGLFAAELALLGALTYVYFYEKSWFKLIEKHDVYRPVLGFLVFLVFTDWSVLFVKLLYRSERPARGLPRPKNNIHYGIDNIAKLIIALGVVVLVFKLIGVEPMQLLTSLSIVAAAIAIISKEFVNDFLVGLYFSFTKNFEINDYVKLEQHKGKIAEIGMFKIKLLNDDDELLIIPNSKIYNNEIFNFTKSNIRLMSVDFQLDIHDVESVEALEEQLIQSLEGFAEYIEPNSYQLRIGEMKKDSIDFKFQYTIRQLDRNMQRQIRRKTVRKVFNYISSSGVGPVAGA